MKTRGRAVLVWGVASALLIVGPSLRAWITDGTPICTAHYNQTDPEIIPDGAGGAFITWTDVRQFEFNIYAQRVNQQGAPLWATDGVPVCTLSGTQTLPQIMSDGSGGAFVAWHDLRDGSGDWDIYAQRIDANGNLLWPDTGVVICDTIEESQSLAMAPDGAGGAILVWQDQRGSANELYVQRVDAGGQTLWNRNGVGITWEPDYEQNPRIISDGGGGAFIVWEDSRAGLDIYGQRIDPDGAAQWATGGVAICTAVDLQRNPALTTDGAGGFIVVWKDPRAGVGSEIYAQRMDPDGVALWTADGKTICNTPNAQSQPAIVSDGAGGAIVTWNETGGSVSDVHAQRIDANGDPVWTDSGVVVCSAPGSQSTIFPVPDGSGGVIAVWEDNRDSFSDIYAQRLSADGSALWATDGVAVCTAVFDQEDARLASDGGGGAIFVWEDTRDNEYDIYGSLVDANGALVPTFLESYEVSCHEGAVTVRWRVASTEGGERYTVYRREASSAAPWARISVEIEEQNGTYTFSDAGCEPGSSYRYRVDVEDEIGRRTLFETLDVAVGKMAVRLHQNHPNPFNPGTTIRYQLSEPGRAAIRVYDTRGSLVRTLVDARHESAGTFEAVWDGRNASGARVASGVYFYRLDAGGKWVTKKMVLVE